MDQITRRQFVRKTGQIALAAGFASQMEWLAACGGKRNGPSTADWKQLAGTLDGTLVLPGEPGFDAFSVPYNRRYADIHPQAVARCANANDVRASILWARDHGVLPTPRAGGHSYAGYSTSPGLLIDVSRMREVAIDPHERTAHVAAGARNTNIYAGLQPHGLAMSAGRCPTVAISGLTLGGGFGFSSRKLGLTSDALLETEVVTADGQILTCSERENSDLFWALRGGGGGNFGINTSYRFKLDPVGKVTLYDIAWGWEDAAEAIAGLQKVLDRAPNELSMRFGAGKAGPFGGLKPSSGAAAETVPTFSVLGQYFGPRDELVELLDPVLSKVRPTTKLISYRSFWSAKNYFFHNVPSGEFTEKSNYVDELFPDKAIDTMIEWVEKWPGSTNADGGGWAVFGWGGKINDVSPTATAFVHRGAKMLMAFETTWGPKDSNGAISAGLDWIEEFHGAMKPYVSPQAYQNFIDPALESWQQDYYGENFKRLTEVKKKYDPDGLFHFAQGIPAA